MGCMQVSSELLQQASDADLIILEGMGRGIETNLHAQFSVDSMKLGMIKHREVTLLQHSTQGHLHARFGLLSPHVYVCCCGCVSWALKKAQISQLVIAIITSFES